MPTISIFFGIVVQMYWDDHNPPHLHSFYQGQEALFEIGTGRRYAGRLPIKAERLVVDWIAEHRDELMRNWERGRMGQPFLQIPGADT